MRPLVTIAHRTVLAAVACPRPLVSCADPLSIVLPVVIGAPHQLIDDYGHDPIYPPPAGIYLLFELIIQEFTPGVWGRIGLAGQAKARIRPRS